MTVYHVWSPSTRGVTKVKSNFLKFKMCIGLWKTSYPNKTLLTVVFSVNLQIGSVAMSVGRPKCKTLWFRRAPCRSLLLVHFCFCITHIIL